MGTARKGFIMADINRAAALISQKFTVKEFSEEDRGIVSIFRVFEDDNIPSLFLPSRVTEEDLPPDYRKFILYFYLDEDGRGIVLPDIVEAPAKSIFVGSIICPGEESVVQRGIWYAMGSVEQICFEQSSLVFTVGRMNAREYIEKYCRHEAPRKPEIHYYRVCEDGTMVEYRKET